MTKHANLPDLMVMFAFMNCCSSEVHGDACVHELLQFRSATGSCQGMATSVDWLDKLSNLDDDEPPRASTASRPSDTAQLRKREETALFSPPNKRGKSATIHWWAAVSDVHSLQSSNHQ